MSHYVDNDGEAIQRLAGMRSRRRLRTEHWQTGALRRIAVSAGQHSKRVRYVQHTGPFTVTKTLLGQHSPRKTISAPFSADV